MNQIWKKKTHSDNKHFKLVAAHNWPFSNFQSMSPQLEVREDTALFNMYKRNAE